MPRESAFARLTRHFHEHPQGRLHEFLFWAGIGAVLGIGSFVGWRTKTVAPGLTLIGTVLAICFFLWALLPQRKPKEPRKKIPGKRGAIAEQVAKSKSERKKNKPVPPGPPIRRG